MDSALPCKIPKCCLLIAKCCRHQGRRDAMRTNIMYRVDNRSFSVFIALLALALAEMVWVWICLSCYPQQITA